MAFAIPRRVGATAAAACLVLLLSAQPAAAWDCVGHMLTAMVAFERASPDVKTALQPLFDYAQHRYFDQSVDAELACWPDDIKSVTNVYSTWHYQDNCYNPTGFTCPNPPPGHMWTALNQSIAKVGDGAVAEAERSFWLSFLIHLVGDAHQPLHVTTLYDATFPDGDLAGNHFYIYYEGKQYRLHAMCDDALDSTVAPHTWLPRPVSSNQTYWAAMQQVAKDLATDPLTDEEVHDLDQSHWSAEGLHLAVTYVYQNHALPNGSTVNTTYWTNVHTMLRKRVALGGARLALILASAVDAAKRTAPHPAPAPSDGSGSKAAAIALSLLIGLVVIGLVVAAVVKRGQSRRRHVELVDDMPFEANATGVAAKA
eukprot:CAMPEP_0174834340 /NCGR_PEP_ID=MMETSP1114-20130205/4771_1 /TAXON_ID=312471 /ORGANISM="Neobodo designis, Strain CCAP 1951/1" /LENGTH=368 /DNA_ID=CAMNT_0016068247 /DNA_START=43 /DNA_END=1149 /DNA_ORIENTATION=+